MSLLSKALTNKLNHRRPYETCITTVNSPVKKSKMKK